MSSIYGLLGLSETDNSFLSLHQGGVWDAVETWTQGVNMDVDAAIRLFVETDTELVQQRYYLPGGGYMQERGGAAESGAVKTSGSWDVGYPIKDFGDEIVGTDVSIAKMRMEQFDKHLKGIEKRAMATARREILRRLFKNTTDTFTDEEFGAVTVQPLANGDAVLYPPVQGSVTDAAEDHYLESGYAAASISNTNNPLVTMRNDLLHHFGQGETGGDAVLVLVHSDQAPAIEALANFIPVPDRFILTGQDTDVPARLPLVPGRILGRGYGCWVSAYDWIPTGYALGLHLDAPPPLKRRVDEAASGMPRGLSLIAQDPHTPFKSWSWRWRFGIGAANRLNGVVMEFGTGGSYTIPSQYA